MATGTFPSELKNAIIVPLLKNVKLDHEKPEEFQTSSKSSFSFQAT